MNKQFYNDTFDIERGTWVSNSGVDSITLLKQLLYQARAHKSTSTDHTCLLSNFLDTGHDFHTSKDETYNRTVF